MSKADDLRKKKMNNMAAPAPFTPRPSVAIQPIAQPVEIATQVKPEAPKLTAKKPVAKTPQQKPVVTEVEVVALYAKVPKEDKRWLDHYRIDAGKDIGEVVSEAIGLLKKQAGNR